jgi:sporulation protein YlmC with PRC-barrel domain
MAGRILHAQLHLLDRQIITRRGGRLLAKVDDLELDLDADVPHVSEILTGPAALGHRMPGLLGAFIETVHRRLHPEKEPAPNGIPAGRIVDITSVVLVDSEEDLRVQGFGDWVDEQIISRIPGAGDAPQ